MNWRIHVGVAMNCVACATQVGWVVLGPPKVPTLFLTFLYIWLTISTRCIYVGLASTIRGWLREQAE